MCYLLACTGLSDLANKFMPVLFLACMSQGLKKTSLCTGRAFQTGCNLKIARKEFEARKEFVIALNLLLILGKFEAQCSIVLMKKTPYIKPF